MGGKIHMTGRLFLFLTTACVFLSQTKISKADLFGECGIKGDDIENIKYILREGNSRAIPARIDDLPTESLRKAMYLLLFYRDMKKSGFYMNDDAIDIIGFENIAKISGFKNRVLNYLINNKLSTSELEKYISTMRLNDIEKVNLLTNKRVDWDDFSDEFKEDFIRKALSYEVINYDIISELAHMHKGKVNDDLLMHQVRLRLYHNNLTNVYRVIDMMSKSSSKEHAQKLLEFYQKVNKRTEKTITVGKGKNKKTKTISSGMTASQVNDECTKMAHYDEYIDLYCMNRYTRTHKNSDDYLIKMLNENHNPTFLPAQWIKYRSRIAREAINKNSNLKGGYEVIANAGELRGEPFYTQAFLAGLLAYIRGDFKNAARHFGDATDNSVYAESNAKAAYWLGIAHKHLGNSKSAKQAFEQSATHVFTMYGQLAAEELGLDPVKEITRKFASFKGSKSLLCRDVVFLAGYMDQKFGYIKNLSPILISYVQNRDNTDQRVYMVLKVFEKELSRSSAITAGMYALRRDVATKHLSFPQSEGNSDNLVNAIIKKETNFKKVIGGKGERGLMQIMPSTASFLAKEMGVRLDLNRLLIDEKYNVGFGKYYIDSLLDRYGGHKILALSAYNAGPLNVDKWIIRNGDLRNMDSNEEVVAWIEKIPFEFTRSYATHILGSEMVYEAVESE